MKSRKGRYIGWLPTISQVRRLFAGMERHHRMLGFVWFDISKRGNRK